MVEKGNGSACNFTRKSRARPGLKMLENFYEPLHADQTHHRLPRCRRDGRVVKGVKFVNLRDAGDPAELAASARRQAPTRLFCSTSPPRTRIAGTLLETVRRTARELFMPFTVGGGIRTLEDAAAIFDAGADKISHQLRRHCGSRA